MHKLPKFFIVVSVLLCLTIFSVACTIEDTPKKQSGDSSAEISESSDTQETFGLNETAAFKNIKVTATSIEKRMGNDFFKPDEGNVFVGVKFTIENTSQEDQSISTLLLFDAYADDVKCDYSLNASIVFDEGTLDGTVSPGKKLVGYYAVEVPADTKKLDLEVKSSWLSSSKAVFSLDVPAE